MLDADWQVAHTPLGWNTAFATAAATPTIVNANIAEYLVPVNADVPDIQTIVVANVRPTSHQRAFGQRGVFGLMPCRG
jgi:CO/xanthine dehydrogenase Mo-binding subunit